MFDLFRKYLTIKNIMFIIMAILLVVFVSKIGDIAIMFFASFVIASSLNPLVDRLEIKFKNRNLASIAVLLSSILLILLVLIPIIVLMSNEIKNFSLSIPNIFNDIYNYVIHLPFVGKSEVIRIDWHSIISSMSNYTSDIVNEIISIGINISSAFIYFIVSIILIYYFMADKDLIKRAYLKFFPKHMKEKANSIYDMISKKIGGYIIALIATLGCVGVIMIVGLALFNVNYAVLLGLLTAIFDIVPIVGPTVALIVCIVATYQSGLGAVIALIGVFAVAQIVENNLVRPYVFGKFLDIHPMIIYLFLFITAKFIGPAGVIFAPAIAATFCVLVEELYIKNLE